MKNRIALTLASVVVLAACSTALAQGRPGGPGGPGGPRGPRGGGTPPVQHLAESYSKVAPFDADKNGSLDATERRALGEAIRDGKVEAPAHRTPPEGVEPPHPGVMIQRIAGLYQMAFAYDTDANGALSEAEVQAIQADIESGKLVRPGRPEGRDGHGRPEGRGGPGGPGGRRGGHPRGERGQGNAAPAE